MNRDVKLLIEKYQSIYETQTNRPAVTELGAGICFDKISTPSRKMSFVS